MSRHVPTVTKLLLLGLLIAVAGCQEPTKDMGADDQSAQSAADRIADLERLLDDTDQARITAEDDALALRTQRDRLRDELAALRNARPAEGWEAVPGGAMITIEGTVLFDSGKSTVKSGGKKTLDAVARVLSERFADHEIYVFGHTDSQPIRASGWKDNYELSCQRALSVVRYLHGKGVMEHMAACGWGEQRPVADNKTAGTRQVNRRVQIFAMAPQREPIAGSVSTARP